MQTIALIALLAAPVAAQSFDPIAYGQRFCQLKQLGVDDAAARKAAMNYAYKPDAPASRRNADITTAANYIVDRNCHK